MLGQEAVADKSNEQKAIPMLLERPAANCALEGALVTIDAIACNPTIADAITGNGADFVLAVKENQPSLRGEIAAFFDATPAESLKVHVDIDIDKDHGRIGSALLGRRAPWGTPSSGRHVNIWVQVSRFRRPMRSGLPCSISPAPVPT